MYKIAVLGDRDSVLGFQALGLDVYPADDTDSARVILHRLAKEGYAIVYLTEQLAKDKNAVYLPIGKKALEYYRHRNAALYSEGFEYISDMNVGDSLAAAKQICESFRLGEIDRVVLVYTKFVSMLSQVPKYETTLPLEKSKKKEGFNPSLLSVALMLSSPGL